MYRSVLWLVPCLLRIQIWTLPVMVFETSFVAYLLVHCWELLLFVKEIYIHVTTLWLAVTYCEKEMYLRCVELVECFFFFYSVYLHLYILTICIFVQFHSFPKQCDIFFFSTLSNLFQYSNLWVYQSGLLYTCIYMYILYLDMLSFVLLSLHLFILFYEMR